MLVHDIIIKQAIEYVTLQWIGVIIMGLYFNPDNTGFRGDISGEIYVDKSCLIEHTNKVLGTPARCIALSHARRFGKSQAAGMLKAYYSKGCDSREIFEQFEIAKTDNWDKYLNKFNVIHLDMSTFAGNYKENLIEKIIKELCEEIAEEYPNIDYTKKFASVLGQVHKVSKAQLVIIIDEWDCVIRNQSDRQDLVHRYMQFLHDLFKSEEAKSFLALGYITGILPIKKIHDESALNNFREFTMINSKNLTKFYGFTEEEVKKLCEKFNMNFDSVHKWYNGYRINGMHMYNPNSVYQCMLDGSLESYWKNTSSYSTINDFITLNFDGLKDDVLKMMIGEGVPVKVNSFQNDLTIIRNKDEALTALIHLGYLGYDADLEEAYIPNYEVETAFESAIETGSWTEVAKSLNVSRRALNAIIRGNADELAEYIDTAHEAYTSIQNYNNENALYNVLYMALFTARAFYNIEREIPAGKGFADMVLRPRKDAGNKPAILIELKYDKSADTAIKQIKEKRYNGTLKGYADKIMLVGVNYNPDTKKHECIIEEFYPAK